MIEILAGAVLALLLLVALPFLAAGFLGLLLLVFLGAILIAALFDWHFALGLVSVLAVIVCAVKGPALLLKHLLAARPGLAAIVQGRAPWRGARHLPRRLAAVFLLLIVYLACSTAILSGGAYLLDATGLVRMPEGVDLRFDEVEDPDQDNEDTLTVHMSPREPPQVKTGAQHPATPSQGNSSAELLGLCLTIELGHTARAGSQDGCRGRGDTLSDCGPQHGSRPT